MSSSIRVSALAFTALVASCVLLPVQAVQAQQGVQRIPVSSILGRLDRLESEVVSLRRSPAAGSDEISSRIDQLESELRRLTGIVERLEYDMAQQSEVSEKRVLDLDTRLQALESQRPSPFAAQAAPQQRDSVGPLATVSPPAAPAIPFAQGSALSQPTVKLGGEPAVAFGTPRQVDSSPDLRALPFPAAPVAPSAFENPVGTSVAIAGASIPPVQIPVPTPETVVPTPTVLPSTDPQAQYDEALRMLNLGEFDSAGSALEALVAQHPQHAVSGSAQYWLGDMHLRLGRYNEAAKAFLDSFKGWPEGPKAPDSLLKLGMTLAGLGQREEACLTFTEFPGRYPNASPTLLRRAQIEAERTQCGG